MSTASRTHNRAERIDRRERKATWRHAPLRIVRSECIACDECVRACPAGFGAIFRHGVTLVIVSELCSGCGKCVPVCPVDCIVDDPAWSAAPEGWWRHAGAADDPYQRRTTGPTAGVRS
ncbi:MAG: 4Fe-4S binding protein [Acidimicrobiia bacterium]|nr:4Fe-4S binding protein [Acidimicrobiia bacterium]